MVLGGGGLNGIAGGIQTPSPLPLLERESPNPYAPDAIIKRVADHEIATNTLRDRMDADYDDYILSPYTGVSDDMSEEQANNEKGYRHYTSNSPKVQANKVISWIVGGSLNIQIPGNFALEAQQNLNSEKERFAIGGLEANDERLLKKGDPPLIDQLSFYANLRGRLIGPCMLRQRPDGSTQFVAEPWDPRHTTWGQGEDGLVWACHKVTKTRLQILTEYGVFVDETDFPNDEVEIFDFYDDFVNTVVMENRVLKEPLWHGANSNPVVGATVGSAPAINHRNNQDKQANYGESIFEATRGIHKNQNEMYSIFLELSARQRKPGLTASSLGGDYVGPEEDPHKAGSVTALDSSVDQKLELLPNVETNRDFASFFGLISGEMQRGGISNINFGENQTQISGFAMNVLRQGSEDKLQPRLRAVVWFLKQCINNWADQYVTDLFHPLSVSGMDRNRNHFQQIIMPESVRGAGDYNVSLEAQLPADDATKWNLATMAITPINGVPIASHEWARENILKIQDVQAVNDQVMAQLAKTASPLARAWEMMQAALNTGDQRLAMAYLVEAFVLAAQGQQLTGIPLVGAMPQSAEAGSIAGAANQSGPVGGFRPQDVPPEFTARGAGVGAGQSGPLQAPGTPRPGTGGQDQLGFPGFGGI